LGRIEKKGRQHISPYKGKYLVILHLTTIPFFAELQDAHEACLDDLWGRSNIGTSHAVEWFLSLFGNTEFGRSVIPLCGRVDNCLPLCC